VANETPTEITRGERIIAYMVAASIGLSIVAFLSVIIGTALGVRDFTIGVWPTVVLLPIIGLPIGFILIIALLVLTFVRRAREAKDAGH